MRPFYDTAQTQERQRRRPVATPFSGHRRRPSVQVSPDRPFGPRYLLRRCQRNSPLEPSNIVRLKFGWTGRRFGWTGYRFGWTNGDPRRCSFRGGGREKRVSENSARFGAIRQYVETREYMSTEGSVLAVGCRSLFESAQLLGRDSRRAL